MERGDRPFSPKLRIAGRLILFPHSCRGLLKSIFPRGAIVLRRERHGGLRIPAWQ
jgi:hypothetical protein